MRNNLLLALILGSLIACKQQTTTVNSASSNPNYTASSCTIGKWSSSSLPINLKISQEFLNDFSSSDLVNNLNPFEQEAKIWNDSISNKTFFTVPFAAAGTTGYTSSSSFHDGEMGIYKSHTWFSDVSSNALAITQYYGYLRSDGSLGSYIDLTHADIIFNYRDYDFTSSTNFIYGYNLHTVIIHEMGHVLGLCHDTTHTSIMGTTYSGVRKTLYPFDITKITDLYVNNKNTLGGSSSLSTSNAITLPEGSFVRGRTELLADGICKHYLNGKLVYEHDTDKKGLVKNKAFSKIYSKVFSKFNKLF